MKKFILICLSLILLSSASAYAQSNYVYQFAEPSVVSIGEYENVNKIWIDTIPVYYITPEDYKEGDDMKICIFLSGLSGNKESLVTSYASYILENGWTAVFFDHYMHGERNNIFNPITSLTASAEEVSALSSQILNITFANMYRYGWEILGNSAMNTQRVLDYFYDNFPVVESVMGGMSMGGDTSLVVAGIDERISRILCLVTAPDWLRPGMKNPWGGGEPYLMDPGKPDTQSIWYFDNFSPDANLSRYAKGDNDVMFVCGEVDVHINPNWVYTFRESVYRMNPDAGSRMGIFTMPGQGHENPTDEALHKLFAWLLSGTELEEAAYITTDEQTWTRPYYQTIDTLPADFK